MGAPKKVSAIGEENCADSRQFNHHFTTIEGGLFGWIDEKDG